MLTMFSRQRGLNIIEILITLTVLGILIALGAPSYFEWVQNQQTRAATEAILNGLQVARAEAIRRNLPVKFQLTALPNSDWTVSEDASNTVIQSRSHAEGTTNASVATTPAGATLVTFAPLGNVIANTGSPAPATVTQIDVSNTALTSGAARSMRITIAAGGSARMCDPDPAIARPDPRAC